jgi:hypothetical protein
MSGAPRGSSRRKEGIFSRACLMRALSTIAILQAIAIVILINIHLDEQQQQQGMEQNNKHNLFIPKAQNNMNYGIIINDIKGDNNITITEDEKKVTVAPVQTVQTRPRPPLPRQVQGTAYYNATEMALFLEQFPTVPMKQTWIDKCLLPKHQKRHPDQKCILHLHIGKNGGTSIDSLLPRLIREETKQQTRLYGHPRAFLGGLHFDWSYILGAPAAFREHMAVICMLRHPVKRAVSHFYFSKQLAHKARLKKMPAVARRKAEQEFQKNGGKIEDTLSSLVFSKDPNVTFFEERDIWQDGQAAVSWLTGTHIASWVRIPKEQIPQREVVTARENVPLLLHMAADRLEQTLWFGILEDVDRSMELLSYAMGRTNSSEHYQQMPITLPAANRGKMSHPDPSEAELEALESLVPQDLWLYEYGQRLFEARWDAYQTGSPQVQLPERPPVPETLSCWSLRFVLNCTSGPLKGLYRYSRQ